MKPWKKYRVDFGRKERHIASLPGKTPPRMREMSTPRSEETPRRVSLPPTQASSHTNTQVEAWNEQPEKTTTTIEAEVHVESY